MYLHPATTSLWYGMLLSCLPLLQAAGQDQSSSATIPFYIGTYTHGSSQGIYRSELNLESGQMAEPQLVAELPNPTFLAIHPSLAVLYAISEVKAEGSEPKQVVAYEIGADGGLMELNSAAAGGDGPCYIATDPSGAVALVANYGSGSISAIAIDSDGSLGDSSSRIQHSGQSVNPQRQQGPHAHCIAADPTGSFALAVDLGLDQVIVYRLDAKEAQLQETGSVLRTEPGSGPRHLTFHPDGKHAFVIHELASQLSSYSWDAAVGKLKELTTVSTLPDDFSGSNSTAEVLAHPNGKFVYGSNRGHDSLAAYAFDASSGDLKLIQHIPTGGRTPRNFRIDPSGKFLLAENQGSDSIHAFRIDDENGELTPVGHPITVGAACCIKFFKR